MESASDFESSVQDTEVSSDDMTTINAETHLMFALQKKKLKAKKKFVSSKRTKLEKSFSDRVKEFWKSA